MGKLGYFVSFVMGGVITSLITWTVCKKKYEDIVDAEIESVKKAYSSPIKIVIKDKDENSLKDNKDISEKQDGNKEVNKYTNNLKKYGYASRYSKVLDEIKKSAEKEEDIMPYIITPEEYGELPEYDSVSLIYYAEDQILATTNDDVVEDIDDIVGLSTLDRFDESGTDYIFVRNDKLKIDYEILKDPSSFSEMMSHKPYTSEDDDE